jgi:hypothetical protein
MERSELFVVRGAFLVCVGDAVARSTVPYSGKMHCKAGRMVLCCLGPFPWSLLSRFRFLETHIPQKNDRSSFFKSL